jgi:hypothetical protein
MNNQRLHEIQKRGGRLKMRDHILMFGLALYFCIWINFRAMCAKEQKMTQKETKEILIKRLMNITESIKKQLWEITGPKKIVGFPQEIKTIKIEKIIHTDFFDYSHVNKHLLLKNIKREEFKRKLKKCSKVLVFGFIVLWSFLTFYGLYKDISWKDYIDQFRWLMFLVDSRLNSVNFS